MEWDKRYRSGSYTPRRYPSPLLVENVEWLPDGLALDVAAGAGRNALFLAERGYDVDAVDVSQEALEIGRNRADERGCTVNWVHADVEAGGLPEQEYDVVTVSFYHAHQRLADVKDRLAPGGVLLIEHHVRTTDPVDRGPNDDLRRFGSNDLLRLCSDLTVLRYSEAIRVFDQGERKGQTASVASLVARNTSGAAQSYPPESVPADDASE